MMAGPDATYGTPGVTGAARRSSDRERTNAKLDTPPPKSRQKTIRTVVGVAFVLTTTMSPGAQVNAAADVALATAPNGAARTPSNSPRVTIPRSTLTPSTVDLPARIRSLVARPLVAA